ncbi:MAG: DUF2202 domain-containing protein [Saprospiraceae bacterium]|nr:DUF2202 domain-containing protein [Saprospiraceae bacterium]
MKKSSHYSVIFLGLGFGFALLLAGCQKEYDYIPQDIMETNSHYALNLANCQGNLDYLPIESLNQHEQASMILMREEEKMARDLYLAFDESWDANTFSNIAKSEQTHMEAMLMLLEKYELADPVGVNGIGQFQNKTLQSLYYELLARGQKSADDALLAAALIEETDITDLKTALESFVDNQDITLIYENLLLASGSQLRELVKKLRQRGIKYVPQLLSQADYEAILAG